MRRSAPSLYLLLFSAGIIAHRFFDHLVPVSATLGACLACLLPAIRFKPMGLLLSLVLGIAWANFVATDVIATGLDPELENQDVVAEGWICSVPQQRVRFTRFDFCIKSLSHVGAGVNHPRKARLKFYHPTETRQAKPIRDKFIHFDSFRAGQQWRLVVRMKRGRGFQNPGNSFDVEKYLFSNRIGATGYVRDDDRNRLLSSPGQSFSVSAFRQDFGNFISSELNNHPHYGVLIALLVGIKNDMGSDTWKILQNTGTIHLVAISGLHIGLISGLLAAIGGGMWRLTGTLQTRAPSSTVAAILGLAGGFGYALLAGMAIPTRRALIMLAVVCVSVLTRTRSTPLEVLSLALACVLLLDPLAALDNGFWLSFSAVAIIIVFLPQFSSLRGRNGIGRFVRVPAGWLSMQLALSIGMAPLVLLLFDQMSIVSPLSNLVAVPVISIAVVPLGLTGMMVFLAGFEDAALWFLELALRIFGVLWEVLNYLGSLHWSTWKPASIPGPVLGAALMGMAIFLVKPLRYPWLISAIWLMPLFLVHPEKLERGSFSYTMLDVGQGLAGVVETRNHVLVYDTGPRYQGGFDTGESIVGPYLRSRGLDRIDTLLISHEHNDHAGGFEAVRSMYQPRNILSGVPSEVAGSIQCLAGQQWTWDGVTFDVLWPPSSGEDGPQARGNNASCVVRVSAGEHSLLLTGDIEAEVEKALVARYGYGLHSAVLQVPHQGSKTSSSWQFLRMVQPRQALVSAGYLNRFGHPHLEITARYKKLGVPLVNTAHSGAVSVTYTPLLQVHRYRDNLRGYWYN